MEMMLTIDFAADMMPAWSWHVLARHKKEPVGGGGRKPETSFRRGYWTGFARAKMILVEVRGWRARSRTRT